MATKKAKDATALDELLSHTRLNSKEREDMDTIQFIDDSVKDFLWSLNLNNQYETAQYGGEREQGFHPSGIDPEKCLRRGVYEYLGVDVSDTHPGIDPKTRLIFDNGHDVHDRWQTYFTMLSAQSKGRIKLIGDWKCFAKGTRVLTADGSKPIESVDIGDKVYDKDGVLRRVTNKFKKRVKKGEMVEVRIGGSNIPLVVTKDHEILSMPVEQCDWKGRETIECWSSCANSKKGCSSKKYSAYKEKWLHAEDLGEGKLVKCVKPRLEGKIRNLSHDLLWILGYYLAEGSTDLNRVSFASSSDEEGVLFPVVRDIMVKEFHNCSVNEIARRPLSKGIEYRFGVGENIKVFEAIGKGVFNKRVPMELFYSRDSALAFIDGWFTGDGHELRGQKHITTANEGLAFQLKALLLSTGYTSSIQKCKRTHGFSKKPFYVVTWSEAENRRPQSGGYMGSDFWAKSSVIESDYEGEVYDLEVEVSHTYNANGIIVHNCKGCGHTYSPNKEIEKPKDGTKCPTCGSTRIKYNEFRIRDKKLRVTGKFDGKLIIDGVPFLLEIKSVNTFQGSKLVEPMKKHRRQVSIYQYVDGTQVVLFLYEDKNSQDVKWFLHHYNLKDIKSEISWLREANFYVDKEVLPPRIHPQCSHAQCIKCEYRSVCKKDEPYKSFLTKAAKVEKPAKKSKKKSQQ